MGTEAKGKLVAETKQRLILGKWMPELCHILSLYIGYVSNTRASESSIITNRKSTTRFQNIGSMFFRFVIKHAYDIHTVIRTDRQTELRLLRPR